MPTIAEPKRRTGTKRPVELMRQTEPKQQFVVYGATWGMYEEWVQQLEGRRIRLTFDGENLEIMSVSEVHEFTKQIVARLIEAYTEELLIPIRGLGAMTLKKSSAERGLEPDECFYIQNESHVRQLGRALDFNLDPGPDLVVEVEVTRSALDRMSIYAQLRVPEVWRCSENTVTIWLLRRGKYVEADKSPAFPNLPLEVVNRFLAKKGKVDDTTLVRAFRDWVRTELLGEE